MNIQDYKGVFVFAQQVDNELSGIALERPHDLAQQLLVLLVQFKIIFFQICNCKALPE